MKKRKKNLQKKQKRVMHLLLRDTLAIERTEMSNERTLYAGIRTALTLFVAGITMLKFIEFDWVHIIAKICIGASVFVMILSVIQYIHNKSIILKQ